MALDGGGDGFASSERLYRPRGDGDGDDDDDDRIDDIDIDARGQEDGTIEYDSNEDIHAALQLSFEDSPDHAVRSSPETGSPVMAQWQGPHPPPVPPRAYDANAMTGSQMSRHSTDQHQHHHRDATAAPYPYGIPAYPPYHHGGMGYPHHYPMTSSSSSGQYLPGVSYHGYPPPPPPPVASSGGGYPAHPWPTIAPPVPPPPTAGPTVGQHMGYYGMYHHPTHHPRYQQPTRQQEQEREYPIPPLPETPTSIVRTPSRTTPAKRKGHGNDGDVDATAITAEMSYDDEMMDEMIVGGGPISPLSSKMKRDAFATTGDGDGGGGIGYILPSTEGTWGTPQRGNARGAIVSSFCFVCLALAPHMGLRRVCDILQVHFLV
jgi:hypothetical protein